MIKISCAIDTTDRSAPLGLEIWLDQKHIFDLAHVKDTVLFEYAIDCPADQHRLQFVMKNKTQAHTQVDNNNNIIKDACLTILGVTIDEFEIHNLNSLAVYQHNFNGTGPTVQIPFWQLMGCNGTVTLNFSVPVYDWLVKNWQTPVTEHLS
jgi:hypothetical protein